MEFFTLLNGSDIFDFVRGPLIWISFIVFFLGIIYQVVSFLSLTRKNTPASYKSGPGKKAEPKKFDARAFYKAIATLKLSAAGTNPVLFFVTTIFHICLVVTPFFVLAHNVLLKTYTGLCFFSFSEKAADILTIVLLACVLFFLYRRIFVARVRAVTTFYDYVMLFLAAAPFLTGFFAYHQIMPDHYRLIVTLHILAGELMLMAVPFTKFVHMLFFFVFRFTIESEYSLGPGDRVW